MDINELSNTQQYFQLFENSKANIRNARLRKGEQPRDLKSRQQLINEHMMQYWTMKSEIKRAQAHLMTATIVGEPYLPSVASLHDLKKISIEQLKLETHHRGSYLLVKTVVPAMRFTAVFSAVEDEMGGAMLFSLYNAEAKPFGPPENVVKEGRVLIIKEPYFKGVGTRGYGIRVDHPRDLFWLSDDDTRIPRAWRSNSANQVKSVEQWKLRGNECVQTGKCAEAVEMYSRALRSSPTEEEAEILHNNRAHAHLKLEAYDAALEDTTFIPDPETRSEKALYRSSQALYHAGKFDESAKLLQILIRKFPGCTTFTNELFRVQRRLAEQRNGDYDFSKMYEATKLRPPRVDCATFKGPVEVRKSEGKGRGLITTRPMKAGELLICEKAFAHCYAPDEEEMTAQMADKSNAARSLLVDVSSTRIRYGTQADLIRQVAVKLSSNPSLIPAFNDLYHGSYKTVSETTVDDHPIVDTFLIAKTLNLTSFGCPLTTLSAALDTFHPTKTDDFQEHMYTSSATYLLASLINHSCIPTCHRSFVGDMMIIRSTGDYPSGTELTFSYRNPSEILSDPNSLSEAWGFTCTCPLCTSQLSTSTSVQAQRSELLSEFSALESAASSTASSSTSQSTPQSSKPRTKTAIKRRQTLLNSLIQTYSSSPPPSTHPRLPLFTPYYSLLPLLTRSSALTSPATIISHCLSSLEVIGYEIEGANLPARKRGMKIKQWGMCLEGTVSVWRFLWEVYEGLGEVVLAEQSKGAGRTVWAVLIGEEGSFEEVGEMNGS